MHCEFYYITNVKSLFHICIGVESVALGKSSFCNHGTNVIVITRSDYIYLYASLNKIFTSFFPYTCMHVCMYACMGVWMYMDVCVR